MNLGSSDERAFAEIDSAMLYIEEARERAERAAITLSGDGAEAHLVQALEEAREQLSLVSRQLRQRTFFSAHVASSGSADRPEGNVRSRR